MRFKGGVFLVGLACFIVGAAGVIWVVSNRDAKGDSAPGTLDLTKTAPAAGIKSLNVSVDAGSIVFTPSTGSEMKAHFTGSVPESQKDGWTLTAETSANGTWNVEASSGNRSRSRIGLDFRQLLTDIASGTFPRQLRLEISLPQQTYENIAVHTGAGRIQLGDVQADTLDVRAAAGSIELDAFKGNTLKLHTDTGSVDFKNVSASGSVTADTRTGRVKGSLAELSSPVSMQANTGAVELDLPAASPARFDLSANVGGISLSSSGSLAYEQKEKRRIIAKSGTGTYLVRLQTGTGRISVNAK
jgi:DUF4097 and DUF4098 domain-containing protein YvlB